MAWNRLPKNDAARFWERCIPEPNTGCWLWLGTVRSKSRWARGVISFRCRPWDAATLAFTLSRGRLPAGQVNHTCDVPLCINPAHLYDGTQLDNMRDRIRRKRWTGNKGEATHHKLVSAEVMEIRRRALAGESQGALAAAYHVDQSAICRIVNGKRWRHLPMVG